MTKLCECKKIVDLHECLQQIAKVKVKKRQMNVRHSQNIINLSLSGNRAPITDRKTTINENHNCDVTGHHVKLSEII